MGKFEQFFLFFTETYLSFDEGNTILVAADAFATPANGNRSQIRAFNRFKDAGERRRVR